MLPWALRCPTILHGVSPFYSQCPTWNIAHATWMLHAASKRVHVCSNILHGVSPFYWQCPTILHDVSPFYWQCGFIHHHFSTLNGVGLNMPYIHGNPTWIFGSVVIASVSLWRRLEWKIYSRTDIISDRRLQRSKHGSNCARSSEQQDMLALG